VSVLALSKIAKALWALKLHFFGIKMDLQKFDNFLSSVDLKKYRELYSPIKIVKMDLDKDIQAIALMYQVYWQERNFLSYDDFYKRYKDEKSVLLEAICNKI
jgi:hypothetical protein